MGGHELKKGTMVMLNAHSYQHDPKFVEDPEVYRPERWDTDEVAARKGTEREVLDHPLLRDPFGFGARMCLGVRVAKLEVAVATARLVRDWHLELEDGQEW